MPPRGELEKLGKIIFSVRDNRITISEVAAWLDLNKPFNNLVWSLNPEMQVEERLSTYLPLTRPKLHFRILADSKFISLNIIDRIFK